MKLSGQTTPFAVLGHPIGHTLSPVMHNAGFHALKMDAVYLALDVHPDKLMDVLPAMRDMGFGGVNLTVPLKEVAANGLDNLAETARLMNSVNTVQFMDDGKMIGHSTDGKGFLLALQEAFGKNVKGLSVLIIGSGGAGRAIAITCAVEGASAVCVADVQTARAEKVAKEVADNASYSGIMSDVVSTETKSLSAAARKADLVVQATPLGMKKDDPSVLPAEAFHPEQMAFDLVYMYPDTCFTRDAKKRGALASNGLSMLLHQGAYSFNIWTGIPAAVDAMRTALEAEVYGGRN